MNAIYKLTKHYKLSEDTARALVDAGLTTPRLIRAASDEQLQKLGVDVKKVREMVG